MFIPRSLVTRTGEAPKKPAVDEQVGAIGAHITRICSEESPGHETHLPITLISSRGLDRKTAATGPRIVQKVMDELGLGPMFIVTPTKAIIDTLGRAGTTTTIPAPGDVLQLEFNEFPPEERDQSPEFELLISRPERAIV